jgi:hypothetical protein
MAYRVHCAARARVPHRDVVGNVFAPSDPASCRVATFKEPPEEQAPVEHLRLYRKDWIEARNRRGEARRAEAECARKSAVLTPPPPRLDP